MQYVLGGFAFATGTASPQEVGHGRTWEWVENEVIGRNPTLQFTGPKPETLEFKGTILPMWKGTGLSIDALALLAAQGTPLLLVNGVGMVMGYWVISQIQDTRSKLIDNGQPKKIEFSISLKRYGDTAGTSSNSSGDSPNTGSSALDSLLVNNVT